MKGEWGNLFWQLPSSDTSTQREVNTTKNLFKTLRDSDIETESAFLDFLWEKTAGTEPPSVTGVTYSREYSDTPDEFVEDVFLVGISRNGRIFEPEDLAPVEKSGGRVDGSILVETDSAQYQFLIEVKTGKDNLSRTQLGKYCNEFGVPPDNVTTIQWRQIHELLESLQPNDEVTRYLLKEFADYIQHQKLDRKMALFKHTKYEKSIILYADEEGQPIVTFRAREKGGSDRKELTRDQYVDLFTEFFDELGLDSEDRRRIFLDGNLDLFTEAVVNKVGSEIASTDIGFSGKARYRINIGSHGEDGGLIKIQEMREDGSFGEFPNRYHFMLTEWELYNVVRLEEGPGFSREVREALFVDLEPERCI